MGERQQGTVEKIQMWKGEGGGSTFPRIVICVYRASRVQQETEAESSI